MITREPEFDDLSRQKILAVLEDRDELCPCGCGQPAADLQQVERGKETDLSGVSVDQVVCKYRARLDLVERRAREKNEKTPEKLDGVLWVARPYDPARDEGLPTVDEGDRRRGEAGGAPVRGRLSRGRAR